MQQYKVTVSRHWVMTEEATIEVEAASAELALWTVEDRIAADEPLEWREVARCRVPAAVVASSCDSREDIEDEWLLALG